MPGHMVWVRVCARECVGIVYVCVCGGGVSTCHLLVSLVNLGWLWEISKVKFPIWPVASCCLRSLSFSPSVRYDETHQAATNLQSLLNLLQPAPLPWPPYRLKAATACRSAQTEELFSFHSSGVIKVN